MTDGSQNIAPVKAQVVIVDPSTMLVVWMNESARNAAAHPDGPISGVPVDEVVPRAREMGLIAALRAVRTTGEPAHLSTGFITTVRGQLTLTTSVYRLPDGPLLVVTDHAYEITPPGRRGTRSARGDRDR